MRKLSMTMAAALIAIAIPSAANATYTFDSVGDTTGAIAFDDFFNTGMSAQLTLTLTAINAATGTYTFSYNLLNNSNATTNAGSRVSSFGFDDDQASNPTGTINSGPFNVVDTNGANYPNTIGTINICLFQGGGQCTGNGHGPTPGNFVAGSFTLDYPGSVSSLTLDNFAVRYQNTGNNGGSSTGLEIPPPPPPSVPEPATWAMMLVGFGATGFAMRRTRRKTLLAQIA